MIIDCEWKVEGLRDDNNVGYLRWEKVGANRVIWTSDDRVDQLEWINDEREDKLEEAYRKQFKPYML